MDRIAHKMEIPLPPSEVFKAISQPKAMGELMPGVAGVEEAHRKAKARLGVGSELDLVTNKGEHVHARIIEHVPNRSYAFEDDRGVRSRWVCVPIAHGTLVTNEILGHFGPERAARLESEAVDRLNGFVELHLRNRAR